MQGSRLQLELEDDGVGIRPETIPDVFRSGIGVSNVYERLEVLFGNEFDMVIEDRPGGGTRVRIQIPEMKDHAIEAAAEAALPSFATGAVQRG